MSSQRVFQYIIKTPVHLKAIKGTSASPCLSSFARMTLLCLERKEKETHVVDRKLNNFILGAVEFGHACS